MPEHPEMQKLCFVVDDNEAIQRLVVRSAEMCQVRVRAFDSLALLRAGLEVETPDLILMDVLLGDADAVGAIKDLKAAGYAGALQLISGCAPELLHSVQAIYERHGFRVLPPLRKPFRRTEVEDVLKRYLAVPSQQPATAVPAAAASVASPPAALLREALDEGWLEFWYQPKIDFHRDKVVGAEALARIRHPEHGLFGPPDFLAGADGSLLDRLTERAVETALRDWQDFRVAGFNLRLSVNAPLASVARVSIPAMVRQWRPRQSDWPGLIVEVKEKDAIGDPLAVQEIATQLRIYDVYLSIDNFGPADAALASPDRLTLLEMKVDRTVVSGCATNRVNRRICRAVIELAHSLNAVAVGEGIENPEDLKTLIQLSCDIGQGKLFSEALPRAALISMLKAEAGWMARAGTPRRAAEPARRRGSVLAGIAQLTPRESEVLQQIVDGKSSKEAAQILGVSHRTIDVHRARIMSKLGAKNVAELVRMTLE